MADQIDVGPPPVQLRGGRSSKGLIVIAVLVVIGAAAGFAWLAYGDRLSELTSTSGPGVAPVAASDTSSVATAEFLAFQQQTSAALQSANDMLSSQQAELKRLSDDVTGLTAKIDQLQSALATARPAPPAAAPRPAAAPTLAAPAAPAPPVAAPAAPRKRPTAPRPAGAISVGGAPLPGSPQPVR